ncbi:MAG: choice-of-anchor B family protein, partial [Candidatus Zixiibacteriota bacterium]
LSGLIYLTNNCELAIALKSFQKRSMMLNYSVRRIFKLASLLTVGLVLFVTGSDAQELVYSLCKDSVFQFSSFGGSDCWGWKSPAGVEYAIMGANAGVAFVNTQTMTVADIVPAPAAGGCGFIQWRDIKTYSHYAYVSSECTGTNQGLMIIDMAPLPDSVHFVGSIAVNGVSAVTCHNLSIDSIAGYLYAEGNSTPSTSIYIHNLATPAAPTFVGSFGISNGIHDMYAYDDTVYVAEGSSGKWAIWNLANKAAPVMLARVSVPNPGYVHNVWPTTDRQHCVTTEETDFKTVKVWDISNLASISLVGEYLAPNGMAHNAQMKGDTIYLSHYESGVTVVDISDPVNPQELAQYDSYPEGEGPPNFDGTWGCYPFASDGLIYGSKIDGRFFILRESSLEVADTLYPGPVLNNGDGLVKATIYATNSVPLDRIVLPMSYAGPVVMFFSHATTTGTRTQSFTTSQSISGDLFGQRVAWELKTTGTPLAPGSGPILTAYFTIEEGNNGPYNQISFTDNWLGLEPNFESECASFRPTDFDFLEICCTGRRGDLNVDGFNANIIDLTFLVDRIYRGGSASICPGEADINADSSLEDIVDLTFLVDLIFRSGPPPPNCN